MTALILKLIAVLTMLIDHSGAVFGDLGLLPFGATAVLRSVGRISFPIFAFLAANGWRHTRSRDGYLRRMLLGALVSAAPYALAFAEDWNPAGLGWNWSLWQTALVLVLLGCALYGCLGLDVPKRGRTAGLTAAFLLLPGLSWRVGAAQLFWKEQSIFYTLAYALFLLSCWDLLKTRRVRRQDVWRVPVLVLFPLLYTFDYGIFGALLVLGLYLAAKKWQTALVLAVFSAPIYMIPYYGLESFVLAGCFCLSALPILFYNGRKGPGTQRWFYAVYPAHLLALGILRIILSGG
jgi:hypothetical protein